MSLDSRHPSHRQRQACPQCAEQQPQPPILEPFKNSRVIAIRDYLDHHITHLKKEIVVLEKKTSALMSRLIREQNQTTARKLQQRIGHLEDTHASLSHRRLRYKTLRKKFL